MKTLSKFLLILVGAILMVSCSSQFGESLDAKSTMLPSATLAAASIQIPTSEPGNTLVGEEYIEFPEGFLLRHDFLVDFRNLAEWRISLGMFEGESLLLLSEGTGEFPDVVWTVVDVQEVPDVESGDLFVPHLCMENGQQNQEIFAMAKATDENFGSRYAEETDIVYAWKASRDKRMIIEIPTDQIGCFLDDAIILLEDLNWR